nr:MAG TPA: hypothetical protein [Caudoviricetes sp.]
MFYLLVCRQVYFHQVTHSCSLIFHCHSLSFTFSLIFHPLFPTYGIIQLPLIRFVLFTFGRCSFRFRSTFYSFSYFFTFYFFYFFLTF